MVNSMLIILLKMSIIEKVEKMEIPYPPVSVQDEFATFVSQVDKSKLSIQASLDQLEILKQSLMKKYFGYIFHLKRISPIKK